METNLVWHISEAQQKLLDSLFRVIENENINAVLDMGSGRTSIQYLTDRFKDLKITGVVFPGDKRKTDPIKECVTNTNYELVERDIKNLDQNLEIDIVLAHLFLGEAEKFAGNKFKEIVDKLFSIKTKYLVMVNLERDNINYDYLNKKISEKGKILKEYKIISEGGDLCLGMTIKLNV
jgi:hypothetical protein